MWSEGTAAAEAAGDADAVRTAFYMLVYFGLGGSSLLFQVRCGGGRPQGGRDGSQHGPATDHSMRRAYQIAAAALAPLRTLSSW